MNIPFVDLSSSLREKEKILKEIKKLVTTNNYILGKEVGDFENKFANYIGTKYSIGLASGADGLLLSMKALEIGQGDEVIIPAMTFMATASAVLHAGAKPVLVDIFNNLPTMDYTKIEQKITNKTKAIIPVHMHGYPCDMKAIQKIAKKYKLVIIEDACQAHGSTYNGKHTGTLGKIAAFSFYPSKNLGAFGDGGAVTTSDKKLAEKIYLLRNQGEKKKYFHEVVGYNSRLDTIQAVVLRVKLESLDQQNNLRRQHANKYSELLKNLPIDLPREPKNLQTTYHIYGIRTKERNRLFEYLKSKHIYCGIHYPFPLHLLPALSFLGHKKGDFPNAEVFADETLSLPMYASLTDQQIKHVVKMITQYFSK